jgi:hypothetical protein
MIKALGQRPNGRRVVILGLSARNLELLDAKKPITVDLSIFGIDAELLVMTGTTEAAIAVEIMASGAAHPDDVIDERT